MADRRPHILYIMSDEHRGQAMTHMGDPNVRTPVMDRLAAEGVSFSRAYANCPICTPSRGTMFSGRHAHAGPVSGFFDVYKPCAPSTATILREKGYHTAYFGKWHCGIVHDQMSKLVRENRDEYKGAANRTPEFHRAGFQDWFAFENLNQHFNSYYYKQHDINPTKLNKYETDGQTDLVIDYLRNYDRDEPLFIVLSVTPPHFPLIVPDEWKRFNPGELQVPPNFTETPHMRECLANYYAMIENLDWNIGRLMDAVADLPQFRDNTLTTYFSDHGDFMGSHGRQSRKEHPHEESVRIPAIFHWPGEIPAQGQVDGLFSLVDLMPTTLGLAGIELPAHNQGTDFSPRCRGNEFAGPEIVLLEMVNNPRWNLDMPDWRGFVTQDWMYTFYDTGDELLFNLAEDPFEMQNLATAMPAMRDECRTQLLKLLAETREPYFDVLIEYGVTPEKVIDCAGK